jgi:hypothetical protein
MKSEQCINRTFLVKLKNLYRNEDVLIAWEESHFTENEKCQSEQVASEGNGGRFLQHQRSNHERMVN